MGLLGKLCRFGSLREAVLVWVPRESCAGLGSLREVVLVWVLSGKLCWFGFSRGSCADFGSFRKVVRAEARFSGSRESGNPLLRKVGGNLLI